MTRYTSGPFDYDHRFHAGNVGDVWKHVALLAMIRALQGASDEALTVVDTHAGAGRYPLGPTGEWTAGIGRLDVAGPFAAPLLTDYAARVDATRVPDRGGEYPGSPVLVTSLLRPQDRAVFVELVEPVRAALAMLCAGDARVEVRGGDGLAALSEVTGRALVFIDPPFTRREEWPEVTAAVLAATRAGLHVLLWYPIKSLQRPLAMQRHLRDAGVRFEALDLITTPLEQKKKALNGSGVLLVGAPAGVASDLAAVMPALGRTLAAGEWTARLTGG